MLQILLWSLNFVAQGDLASISTCFHLLEHPILYFPEQRICIITLSKESLLIIVLFYVKSIVNRIGWRYPRGIMSFKTCYTGMKNAFLRPLTMRKNVFWVSKNQISMEKRVKNFDSKCSHLLMVRAEGADPPTPLTVSLTVRYPLFFGRLA